MALADKGCSPYRGRHEPGLLQRAGRKAGHRAGEGRDGLAQGFGRRLEMRRRHLERRPRAEMSSAAALGFAPHSGWSVLVALGLEAPTRGPVFSPVSASSFRAGRSPSKQPYHAVESLPIEEAARKLAVFEADAERRAHAAIAPVLASLVAGGFRVVGVGILDAAGRKGASLEATLASHALIHTADGNHFRSAIANAAESCGLGVTRVRIRELGRAGGRQRSAPHALREALQALRREAGPPGEADQKAAARSPGRF